MSKDAREAYLKTANMNIFFKKYSEYWGVYKYVVLCANY
jgi:hypothetical protein